MIEGLNLSADYANQLHPFVQDKYRELWTVIHSNPAEP
jgi:hypothetical protein